MKNRGGRWARRVSMAAVCCVLLSGHEAPRAHVRLKVINVSAALPDLIVKEIKIVGTSKLRVVVQNQGSAAAPKCVLQIKVFKGILSDVLYSTRLSVPALPSHQTKVLIFNTRGRPLDGNSIRAIVDPTNLVEEADEDNNEENLITAP
jgi:subtilase family serine protease